MQMPIQIVSVTNSVVEYLRSKIITGELAGGQKLIESQLSSQLGISHPPIREAFRILEHEHIITTSPRKGVYINEVSVKDCQEVYQMRKMLECYAIDLLKAQNISSLQEVASTLTLASGLSIPPDYDQDQRMKYLEIFAGFHIKLVEACGNKRLNYFYKSIQSTLYRYQFMYLAIPGSLPHSLQDHHQVLNSIEAGAYEEAKTYLGAHIDHAFELLKARIEEDKING